MGRRATGIRWYESKKSWYAWINGGNVKLGPDREQATMKWLEAVRSGRGETCGDHEPVGDLLTSFLAYIEAHRRPATHHSYSKALAPFMAEFRDLKALALRPYHAMAFLERRKTWGVGSKRIFVSVLRSAFSWGVKQGLLSSDPLKGLDRPRSTSRGVECTVTLEQHLLLLSQAEEPLADFLRVLWHTGSRPTALMLLEARDVKDNRALMQNRAGLKVARVVLYFNAEAAEIVKRCAERNPEGPIFRGPTGKPWTRDTLHMALRPLRRRCGCKHVTPYSYRHAYAQRALRSGVPLAYIAELLNTSAKHIEEVYGHPDAATDVLAQAVERI